MITPRDLRAPGEIYDHSPGVYERRVRFMITPRDLRAPGEIYDHSTGFMSAG